MFDISSEIAKLRSDIRLAERQLASTAVEAHAGLCEFIACAEDAVRDLERLLERQGDADEYAAEPRQGYDL